MDESQAGIFDDRLAFEIVGGVPVGFSGRGQHCRDACSPCIVRACRKARRAGVGNNDYRNVPKLQKAVNDARTMGDTLKQLGFTVMVAENQNRQAFSETLLAFDKSVEAGDTAFFFFAGHGFEIARPEFSAADRRAGGDRRPGRAGARRLDSRRPHHRAPAEQGARTAILVFDACRNNPFERAGTRAVAGARRARADDAIAGRRVLDLLGRSPADRARPALQR